MSENDDKADETTALKEQVSLLKDELQRLKLEIKPVPPGAEELDQRVKGTLREEPKPDPRLADLDDIKNITIANAMGSMSEADKKRLQPVLEGMSLKKAMETIQLFKSAKVVEPVGVPPVGSTGGLKAPGYFDAGYQHDFMKYVKKKN